jgi:hypothetical protein
MAALNSPICLARPGVPGCRAQARAALGHAIATGALSRASRLPEASAAIALFPAGLVD